MKIIPLALLAISAVLLSGCGVNIVSKSESSEEVVAVNSLTVVVDRSSIEKYTIRKVITSHGGEQAKISEANKTDAKAIVSQVAGEFPPSVEGGISKQLQSRGVNPGKDYRLVIVLDTFQIRFHGDPSLLSITSSFIDLTYSATLYRVRDMKPLWKASFRRPNGSTSSQSLQTMGDAVGEKVFSELANSGWIKK